MDGARTLLVALSLAGCLDPADQRADRDLDQLGGASLGAATLRIDPGIVLSIDPALPSAELRASGAAVRIELAGSGTVRLRVSNLPADAEVDGALSVAAPEPTVRELVAVAPAVVTLGPPPGPRAFRFAFFSDVHADATAAAAIADRINADPSIELAISGGDLVDTGAAVDEWDRTLAGLAGLRVPLYGTTGNHELNGGDGEQFQARFGRMNLAFDFHGVRFLAVDSGSGTVAARVMDFLRANLADAPPTTVFVTHIPPLDPGGARGAGFASRLEAEALLGLLAGAGVDLTLYGHIHTHTRFANAGIPAHISGGGAVSQNELDAVGRHFLVVDVAAGAPAELTVTRIGL